MGYLPVSIIIPNSFYNGFYTGFYSSYTVSTKLLQNNAAAVLVWNEPVDQD